MAGNLSTAAEREDEQTVHVVENDDADSTGKLFRLPLRRGGLTRRTLFLRWVVLQAVVATLIAAAAIAYGDQLHGASLVMVPLILIVLAGASGYGGLLAWRLGARLGRGQALRPLCRRGPGADPAALPR